LQHQDSDGALELFQQAAQSSDPLYSPMARISLALMLHAQKKEQKALFELRKVVGSRKPSAQSVVALGFIVAIMGDMGSKVSEVQRARAQQIEHLLVLLDETDEDSERAALLLQLGVAYFDQKQVVQARETLQQVLNLGEAASEQIDDAKAVLTSIK